MCICTLIHMCNYLLTRSRFTALASGTSATLRKAAAPRHASQRLATRLQHASRGLDTLNGRSATRRPEKETNQMHCTEDIVLRQRVLRRADRVRALTPGPCPHRFAVACALALRFTCATTYSRRVFGGIHIAIHNYARAHAYTCPVLTIPPESVKLTIPPKSVMSPHKRR